jgi:pimeloyl-ACP methyl ester carboxylesterase
VKLRRLAVAAVAALALIGAGLAVLGALQRPHTALPPGARGRFADVDGIRLRYVQAGQGPDVLLIHGSPGSLEDWDPVFDRLAARFRVTAFDRTGHGYSEGHRRPHTVTENARVSLGLIRALGLRDVVVVGHSYGGATALGMAEAAPPEVRALVVVGSRAYPPVRVEPIVRALAVPYLGPGLAVLLGPVMARARMESGARASFGPNAALIPAGFIETRVALWSRPTIVAALSQERATFQDELTALSARYPTIRRPLWVVCGDADPNFADAQRLAREVPGAHLVPVAGTGHYVQFARPEVVLAAIDETSAAP